MWRRGQSHAVIGIKCEITVASTMLKVGAFVFCSKSPNLPAAAKHNERRDRQTHVNQLSIPISANRFDIIVFHSLSSLRKYEILQRLGKGAYGYVWKVVL